MLRFLIIIIIASPTPFLGIFNFVTRITNCVHL